MKEALKAQIIQYIDKMDITHLHILKGFIEKLLGLTG